MKRKCKTLKQVMEEEAIFCPCVCDAISLKVMESAGFHAGCVSGSAVAAGFCGLPDIGLVSLEDLVQVVERLTAISSIPLIVDIDTGFGSELSVYRTCERIAQAGAMAVHLEDQTFPKRCGHLNGKEIIPREDYFRKIRIAAAALKDTDCLLIARTDSYHIAGVEEAIYRNLGALENGADITFTEGTGTIADIEMLAKRVPGWKMFDMLVKGASPKISFEDLVDYGYRLVTAPALCSGGATMGVTWAAQSAVQNKSDVYNQTHGWTPGQLQKLVGLEQWNSLSKEYCNK